MSNARWSHGVANEGDAERHHHCCANALDRSRRDQHGKGRREARRQRRACEERDPELQQAPAPDQVTEPAGTDDDRGDGEQVREHDPLHRLE